MDLPVEELEMKDDGGGFFYSVYLFFSLLFLQKCFFCECDIDVGCVCVCVCDINVGFVWQNVTQEINK